LADSIPFYSDSGLEITFWRNVILIDASSEVTMNRARRLWDGYRALLAEHPRGIAALAIMRSGVPVSSLEVRNDSVRFMKELGSALLTVVTVIEDNGIFSQVMRTVMRGFFVLSRGSRGMHLVGNTEDAARAVLPFVTNPGGATDLDVELRQILLARRPPKPAAPPAVRQAR
jgi:hypothetical protein